MRVLRAIAGTLGLALMLATPAAAAGISSSWTTDFGALDLSIDDRMAVTGSYPKYRGRIHGRMSQNGQITAYWLQPTSERACGKQVHGTWYWGVVVWTVRPNGDLDGEWSYCRDRPGAGGTWSGQLLSGASPTALLGAPGGGSVDTGNASKDPADVFLKLLDVLTD